MLRRIRRATLCTCARLCSVSIYTTLPVAGVSKPRKSDEERNPEATAAVKKVFRLLANPTTVETLPRDAIRLPQTRTIGCGSGSCSDRSIISDERSNFAPCVGLLIITSSTNPMTSCFEIIQPFDDMIESIFGTRSSILVVGSYSSAVALSNLQQLIQPFLWIVELRSIYQVG